MTKEEKRRQTRGWQQLIGIHSSSLYMTKGGEIQQQHYRVLEKYHYNAGGRAFCGVSLYRAEPVAPKKLRQRKHMRCQKCLAALRHALA